MPLNIALAVVIAVERFGLFCHATDIDLRRSLPDETISPLSHGNSQNAPDRGRKRLFSFYHHGYCCCFVSLCQPSVLPCGVKGPPPLFFFKNLISSRCIRVMGLQLRKGVSVVKHILCLVKKQLNNCI